MPHPSDLLPVPNRQRTYRANGLPKVGGLSRGNSRSSYLGSCRPTPDLTERFGDVFPGTNFVRPYYGRAYVEDAVSGGRTTPKASKSGPVSVRRKPTEKFVQGVDPCPGCGMVTEVAKTCFCW